jgi:hypothetical protein
VDVSDFPHRLAAHCETGVTSTLFSLAGISLSEPQALGIGSGLFFIHLPFDSFFGQPTVSFRAKPGSVFKKVCRRLRVKPHIRRYSDPKLAHDELLRRIDSGKPTALQTSVYFLDYLPRRFRFPFNAHNIVVYGRKDGRWLVSDPVLEGRVECEDESLTRARFAAGLFAPRGKAYWVEDVPSRGPEDLKAAMQAGMRETGLFMAHCPIPTFGWRAIALLARRVAAWPGRFAAEPQKALLQLANVVRMQEEIGTGGAGFRYLYAAFLQQTSELFGDPGYAALSERLTAIGDEWRKFGGHAARLFRGGQVTESGFAPVVDLLARIAESERSLFYDLNGYVRGRRRLLPAATPVEERLG